MSRCVQTVPNMARLAEVLVQHRQPLKAFEANAEACRRAPTHLNLRLKQTELLSKAEKHGESLQEFVDRRNSAYAHWGSRVPRCGGN